MSEQPQVVLAQDGPAPTERERFPLDVLFVGGGPAGLAGALRLAQLTRQGAGKAEAGSLEIAVIEKAEEFGHHGLSGAVFNPASLAELLPDYRERGCPLGRAVGDDAMFFLTPQRAWRLPGFALPPSMHNRGFAMVSLQRLTRWMAEQTEQAGVTLFPGTTGVKVLYEDGRVAGVRTGDKGLGRSGVRKGNFEAGYDLSARVTVFCEGPRGTLAEDVIDRFDLRSDCNPQQYSLGTKEVVRVPRTTGRGIAYHTLGHPLPAHAFGGGFLYEMDDQHYAIGFVVGLDWGDPTIDVQEELQRFKAHPFIHALLAGGEVVHYGAKTIPEGGYWAIPRLHAPGALLAGDSAGLVNVPTLKGIHYAIRSGMLAAECTYAALTAGGDLEAGLAAYRPALERSEVGRDLWASRNFRASFHHGLYPGLMRWGGRLLLGGGSRTRIPARPDWMAFRPRSEFRTRPAPPKPDGKLFLDKLGDVHRSGTAHRDDAPAHIRVVDPAVCSDRCLPFHGVAPCEHFCPARVYELQGEGRERRIEVAFQNCVHCKTCVIADPCGSVAGGPIQNIEWRAPAEGGPKYLNL